MHCGSRAFITHWPVISLPNPGSVGLHEAMGFQPLGVYQGIGFKNGAWHDVLWLQLQLRERDFSAG